MASAQVKSFLAVAKYKSFSKAADHLYVSQSAISKNVAQLEKAVGYILIDRSYGAVKLTVIGELFFKYYSENEEKYQKLLATVQQLTLKQAEDIRLGCLDGWDLSQFYPQIRKVYKDKYPGVHINLEGYNHVHVLYALEENKIDLAITLNITLPHHSKFISRTIATAPAVVLFSSSHPLAGKDDISLIDFKDEPFYVITPANQEINPMEQLTLSLCRSAGFEPKLEYVPTSASILLKLQSGVGAQITCQWTCASRFPVYKTLPLDHKLSICAAWLDDERTPSKHLFVNELLHSNIDEK